MRREYVERVKYKDFLLARWQETVNGVVTRNLWDIVDHGWVVSTVSDREHA